MNTNSETRYQTNSEVSLYDIEKNHYKVPHEHNSYHVMSFGLKKILQCVV